MNNIFVLCDIVLMIIKLICSHIPVYRGVAYYFCICLLFLNGDSYYCKKLFIKTQYNLPSIYIILMIHEIHLYAQSSNPSKC